jgi:hypothetical protein
MWGGGGGFDRILRKSTKCLPKFYESIKEGPRKFKDEFAKIKVLIPRLDKCVPKLFFAIDSVATSYFELSLNEILTKIDDELTDEAFL